MSGGQRPAVFCFAEFARRFEDCLWRSRYAPGQTAGSVAGETDMDDRTLRQALQRHWKASDAGDFEAEHEIYHGEAVLEYPQSGERIRGRATSRNRRVQPNKKRFTVRRVLGGEGLWVTEFILTYDGAPSYTVRHHGNSAMAWWCANATPSAHRSRRRRRGPIRGWNGQGLADPAR